MDVRIASVADSCSSNTKKKMFLFNTDRPSAADIAFAALSFPILIPLQCSSLFATAKFMSDQDAVLAAGFRRMADVAKQLIDEHRSARYALQLYDTWRFPPSHNYSRSGASTINGSSNLVVIPKSR